MLAKSKMDSCQHLGPDLRQNHKELKLSYDRCLNKISYKFT